MFRNLFRRIRRDRRGAVVIELAAALPMLALMTIGGVELTRYLLLHQKLEHVATTSADLVARARTMTATDMQNVFFAVEHVLAPFPIDNNGVVIISSVTNQILWQQRGAGTMPEPSKIGGAGGAPTLPTGFTMQAGESVIIAEVYYDYVPWIFNFLSPERLYQRAMFRPRESNTVDLI